MNTANTVALDLAPLMAWIIAAMTVINFGILMKGILTSGEKVLVERAGKHEVKLTDHDRRIQELENEITHLPTKENIHKQQIDISDMKGEIGVIKKTIEATERTTRRVEDFLLKGAA